MEQCDHCCDIPVGPSGRGERQNYTRDVSGNEWQVRKRGVSQLARDCSPGVARRVVVRARSGVLLSRCNEEQRFAQLTGVQRADREQSAILALSRVSGWCGAAQLTRGEVLLG